MLLVERRQRRLLFRPARVRRVTRRKPPAAT